MTRFKKEIRNRGYKLENDYPSMPYETESATIDSVSVDSETATLTIHTTSASYITRFNRAMQPKEITR